MKIYIDFCEYYIFDDSSKRMVGKKQIVDQSKIPFPPVLNFDYSKLENWQQKIEKEVAEGKAVIVPLADCSELYNQYWNSILEKQKKLLNESNWTQLKDVFLKNNEQWVQYRKELLDIPEKYKNNPCGVVWPVKPA